MTTQLDDVTREMLEFETRAWVSPHVKERAIQARFGMRPVRYYQRLFAVIDLPEVEEADPMTVHRLRRLRERRAGERVMRARAPRLPHGDDERRV